MGSELKFTVVVPTRQRADVLGPALKTIVTQDYDNLEILVSDNYSDDHTKDVVRSFADPRIRYINTGYRRSMSHNWEYALSHVSAGWVAIVGDDDGLMPGALAKVTQIIHEYDVKAVASANAAYLWPSAQGEGEGRLTVSLRGGCEVRDSQRWLTRVLRGKAAYSDLPMLYTGGFVASELIAQARDQSGTFYRSMVPDVYSAVAFSKILERYVFCHEVLGIGGSSKHSTGTAHFSTKTPAVSSASPAKAFFSEPNIPFHPDLGVLENGLPPQAIELLAYESFLQSAHLTRKGHLPISDEAQLEVVLRGAKRRHRESVDEWGASFAERRGLDFRLIRKRARRGRIRDKALKGIKGLMQRRNSVDIRGDTDLPIRDVFEASIVAATVRKLKGR